MERDERIKSLERQVGQMAAELRELRQGGAAFPLPRLTGSFLLLTLLVLLLGAICARRAWAAVTTPSAAQVALHTEPSGVSTAIAIPVANQPVIISGTTYSGPFEGTGFVHLGYMPATSIVTWTGLHAEDESNTSPGIAAGYTRTIDIKVVDVAYAGAVELRTGPAISQLHLRNTSGNRALDTRLTLIW